MFYNLCTDLYNLFFINLKLCLKCVFCQTASHNKCVIRNRQMLFPAHTHTPAMVVKSLDRPVYITAAPLHNSYLWMNIHDNIHHQCFDAELHCTADMSKFWAPSADLMLYYHRHRRTWTHRHETVILDWVWLTLSDDTSVSDVHPQATSVNSLWNDRKQTLQNLPKNLHVFTFHSVSQFSSESFLYVHE